MKGDQSVLLAGVAYLIKSSGDDPLRAGMKDTPRRFIEAFSEYTRGYETTEDEIGALLKQFDDGVPDGADTFVVERDIPFYSLCEHHLAPFFGVAHVGYIPTKRIVGLSKIPRLVEVYARRFQVQERLTCQIADAIQKHLSPLAVGVVLEARHLCVESRGSRTPGATTLTSSLLGAARHEPDCRAEFYKLIGK